MKPYQSHVEAQCGRNPCLYNLCRFLADPTSNNDVCRIASLDFFAGAASPRQRMINVDRLRSELVCGYTMSPVEEDVYSINSDPEELLANKDHLLGQILIVEDITKEVIEVLGSCLSVDPLFFASHIHAPWKELDTQTPDLATLPSRKRSGDLINVHYHRTIVFEKVLPPGRKLLRDANVDRKVMVLPLSKKKCIGLAQHCVSLLRVARKTHWICLVLVDPPIKDRYLFNAGQDKEMSQIHLPSQFFLGGYEDFLDPPSINDKSDKRSGPGRHCLMEDLLYYWSLEPPACFSPEEPTLLSLSYYPLRIVAAEWAKYVAVMHRSVKQYEYSNDELPNFLHELGKLNSDMRALQSWRRRSISSEQKVRAVVRLLRSCEALGPRSERYASLIEDYEYIAANVDAYSRRLESMLPVVTSLVQIVDSRRSFAETANISRLTILALVFVPLTFISSVFSMNSNNGPGGPYFWVYFAVAVPVTLVVFLIARPPVKEIRLLLDQFRIRRKSRRSVEPVKPSALPSKKTEV